MKLVRSPFIILILFYVDNMMFGAGNDNEQNPPRNYFGNYRNYDPMPNDSFYQATSSFRGDPMDFNDTNFNRTMSQSFGGGYNNQMDFKFGPPNPMMNQNRIHQNSFNNPFADPPRGQSFGSDYFSNVMNPNNMQFSGSMNNGMNNYYNYGQRRQNTFGHKR